MPLHFYLGVLLIIWDVEKGFNYFSLGTRFHHFFKFLAVSQVGTWLFEPKHHTYTDYVKSANQVS